SLDVPVSEPVLDPKRGRLDLAPEVATGGVAAEVLMEQIGDPPAGLDRVDRGMRDQLGEPVPDLVLHRLLQRPRTVGGGLRRRQGDRLLERGGDALDLEGPLNRRDDIGSRRFERYLRAR